MQLKLALCGMGNIMEREREEAEEDEDGDTVGTVRMMSDKDTEVNA